MEILTGAIIISLLHALIPNHWLPILAIGKQSKWSINKVTKITFYTATAHVLSTVVIGLILGFLGYALSENIETIVHYVAPTILIVMGLYFIYQHYHHNHFHLHKGPKNNASEKKIILSLVIAMLLSPCMEIEPLFLLAGTQSTSLLLTIALAYSLISIIGMLVFVRIAYKGILKFDSHKLEHNAGIITGIVLLLTGIASFYF